MASSLTNSVNAARQTHNLTSIQTALVSEAQRWLFENMRERERE